VSNLIGHHKVRDTEGKTIVDEAIVFTSSVNIDTDIHANSKDEYKTLLKRTYDTNKTGTDK